MARTTNAYPIGTMCSVPGCPKKAEKRGMCNPHYQRQRLGKSFNVPMRPKQFENLQEHFNFYTVQAEHGFLWTGGTNSSGYGQISSSLVATRVAHRVAWELVYGPIPEGMELDHLPDCPKNCVTVSHLTPRTKSDHAKIGWQRGQFEGNGWLAEAREKRTKTDICLICGVEYVGDTKSMYCSPKCRNKSGNDRRPKKVRDEAQRKLNRLRQKICALCGTEYEGDLQSIYCSSSCSNKVYNSRRKKK